MLFHDAIAPSPRRVRIFIAEKGLTIPSRIIDLGKGEQLSADYLTKNPRGTVPTLQLDDGTCLWDTLAICEYLEAQYPDVPLLGRNAVEHAKVVMWYQRIEIDGFHAVAEVFRNASRTFKDRALPGTLTLTQIPDLVPRGKLRMQQFYAEINDHLKSSSNVAGDFYSLADIQLLCILDFAKGWGRLPIPEDSTALLAWHQQASARPSSKL